MHWRILARPHGRAQREGPGTPLAARAPPFRLPLDFRHQFVQGSRQEPRLRPEPPVPEDDMALTRRQREILDFVAEFIRTKRYSPSLEEIAAHFGLNSVATVHKHVSNLEKKGFIRRSWNRSRSIDLLATELPVPPGISESGLSFHRNRAMVPPIPLTATSVPGASESIQGSVGENEEARLSTLARLPLLGRVAAGRPVEAVSNPETIAVPASMIGRHPCFVLQVAGTSMIGEHIQDGDYVIVEQRATARDGEKVIALIDGGDATLKTYFRDGDGSVRLVPANPELQTLTLRDGEFRIQGVVIGVMRKYRN
jgi:repressor LexA